MLHCWVRDEGKGEVWGVVRFDESSEGSPGIAHAGAIGVILDAACGGGRVQEYVCTLRK